VPARWISGANAHKEAQPLKLAMNRRPWNEQATTMPHLEIGSQVFHNGVPLQLLYRIDHDEYHETWRVRPLFVEAADRDDRFHRSDVISFLHTIRAPR